MRNKMQIPLPQAPHPDTLADPRLKILSADRDKLICYCPRNHCGALLDIQAGLWAIYCPLSFQEFYNTLGQRGVALPAGDDYETWLQALGMAADAGTVSH